MAITLTSSKPTFQLLRRTTWSQWRYKMAENDKRFLGLLFLQRGLKWHLITLKWIQPSNLFTSSKSYLNTKMIMKITIIWIWSWYWIGARVPEIELKYEDDHTPECLASSSSVPCNIVQAPEQTRQGNDGLGPGVTGRHHISFFVHNRGQRQPRLGRRTACTNT